MKEIAKKKSKLWAPVVHMAVPQIVKTPDSCVFLHFLVHKNPTQGSKFSRKKKFFIPLGNKVYEGFGTFSGILFNDNFTPNFGTCR